MKKNWDKLRHGHKLKGKVSPTYHSWVSMKSRCLNIKRHNYKYYGGRGITICDRWVYNFDNFLLDMGVRPNSTSLDRIDNDGNYEPKNCKWSNHSDQVKNRRKCENKNGKIDPSKNSS